MSTKPKRVLSVFSLVMINVIAIDSLRNLPINAEYGYAIIFLYILGAICFLIPCALVTAELATQWPKTGGTYVWVSKAFGTKYGFLNIWLQWIYNVVWFPTILAFIGATLASIIDPKLATDRHYMVAIIIICFLLATYFNCKGMRVSSLISELGAILGTILPMVVIIILGLIWLHGHKNMAAHTSFIPNMHDMKNATFFISVLFSLIGIEMSAVHAEEVKNPARDYPRALLISSIIIMVSLIFASLAIAVAVPQNSLSMINGLNQAFKIFFASYHLSFLFPVLELLIIIGGFAGMAAWVIGPTKGLMIAARDGCLPKKLARTNKKNVPTNLLILQAVIVIILSLAFLLFPNVAAAYWILSALTAQLAVIYYITLFLAVIKLRKIEPKRSQHAFIIPFGKPGLYITAGLGILTCVLALGVGFIPPSSIKIGSTVSYELSLLLGIIIFAGAPFVIYKYQQRKQG